ncbi:MAG: hypothetical protein QOG01_4229 [Pseudonocardiales bacterium]|jgi:hypothetical protein|nr:hypothetical protein [Pseudonocardiales bacterium]
MFTLTVVVTALLAALFLAAGGAKLASARQSLSIRDHLGAPPQLWRMIGLFEAAGVAGVVIGLRLWALGVAAAVGLLVLSIGAIASHVRVHDKGGDAVPAVLGVVLALAAVVLRIATA